MSRPKFWLYTAGPYLVAYVATMSHSTSLLSFQFFTHFLFFLIPANIFLYGINDYFDRDTDAQNPKKGTDEQLLTEKDTSILGYILLICGFLFFIFISMQGDLLSRVFLSVFFLLSAFYSMPPLRFKARPIIDSLSNILYVIPAFVAISQNSGTLPSTSVWVIGLFWAAAMHLFSAIPDIKPDAMVNLATTAVVFGKKISLLICLFLWVHVSLEVFITPLSFPWSIISLVYPLICFLLLMSPKIQIEAVYRRFPIINILIGMLLTFWIISVRFLS